VFADKAELFNRLVQRICTLVDHQLDLPPHSSSRSRLRRVCSDVGHLHSLPLSSMRGRRSDSQHVIVEENSLYLELGSHVSPNDESRPVFVVAEEDLH